MLIPRAIATYLTTTKALPVLAILGPRQSGKTTLAKALFKDKPYVNLENPETRAYAIEDPQAFLQTYQQGALFDEIQNTPEILSYLQGMVDDQPTPNRFVLTGSHQLMLHASLSQSLAGRINLTTLLPLSLSELKSTTPDYSVDDYLLHGFYPRIYHEQLEPALVYRNYFETYIERDVRALMHLKDLNAFIRFIKLCAGRIGQLLNIESLANDVGVSATTIKNWLSILEVSFVIKLLPPYFENFGKRLIKSPKLFFIDVGLAAYLLEIETLTQLKRDPLRGHLLENMVIMEWMKYRFNQGKAPNLYFYRDSNGTEVDGLYKTGHDFIAFEVKAAQTYHADFLNNLNKLQKLLQERLFARYLIYTGTGSHSVQGIQIVNCLDTTSYLSHL
jgi:predicted AAA+ superfamily ATPase